MFVKQILQALEVIKAVVGPVYVEQEISISLSSQTTSTATETSNGSITPRDKRSWPNIGNHHEYYSPRLARQT